MLSEILILIFSVELQVGYSDFSNEQVNIAQMKDDTFGYIYRYFETIAAVRTG